MLIMAVICSSAMLSNKDIASNRARSMSPEHPNIRGTSQNPDVFFQARETVNSYYKNFPDIVTSKMALFGELTGRDYKIFEYIGATDADRVIIIMGSGADTVEETVSHLETKGEKVGVLKVRLYRPFYSSNFVQTLPNTIKAIAVLDRTKEPGSEGEPLYKDVCTSLFEHGLSPKVMKRNLAEMVKRSQNTGANVLLLSMRIPPNYGKRYVDMFYNVYPQLSKELNIPYVPFILEDVALVKEMMQKDGLHPNAMAQPIIADKIWLYLQPILEK